MDWKTGLGAVFSDLFTKRSMLLLALLWFAGGLAFASYGTLRGQSAESFSSSPMSMPVLRENETGPLMAWRRNRHVVGEPDYRMAFDNLRAENAGPASPEPAARKVVHIENLDLIFERSSIACDDARDGVRLRDFHDLLAPAWTSGSPAGLREVLDASVDEPTDLAMAIDLTNTGEVRIHHMDWRVCREDTTVLRVQCTEAQLVDGTSEVLLQGGATVTAGDAVLQSGRIRMDAHNDLFLVDGLYLWTRHGDVRVGFGGCFDAGLDPLADSPAPYEGSTENLGGFNNETSI